MATKKGKKISESTQQKLTGWVEDVKRLNQRRFEKPLQASPEVLASFKKSNGWVS